MISKTQTLGDIITSRDGLSLVLGRFDINITDLDQSLEHACLQNKVDPDFFVEVLNAYNGTSENPEKRMRAFSIPVILEYLYRTHFFYLNKRLPEIEQSIAHLEDGPTAGHPIIPLLDNFFKKYTKELSEHIKNEEKYFMNFFSKHLLLISTKAF